MIHYIIERGKEERGGKVRSDKVTKTQPKVEDKTKVYTIKSTTEVA